MQRFRCLTCRKSFSTATYQRCYRQKKRHKNLMLRKLLCSGVSQRRCAKILSLNRKTVVEKFLFMAIHAEFFLRRFNLLQKPAHTIEFDDLETFEHTKLKPLSVTLAVESGTRRILGVEVSRMAANGPLAEKSREKYGPRVDERREGRGRLLQSLKPIVAKKVVLKSDENPYYPADVKWHFPESLHLRYKGKRGSTTGQGELKRVRFDPIFSLNHTCAMLRANINRLFRKTWCTSKRSDRLYAHLVLYAQFHNQELLKKSS
ncbi:MAG: transposase [Bdellovibrionota bacterium]